MTTVNGDICMCHWERDQRRGYCIEIKDNGETWQGNQIDGVYFGKVKITYESKDTYSGDYDLKSMRYGKGVEIKKSGDKYKGGWLNDKYHGEGELTFANKDSFKGAFFEGQKHGLGVEILKNGDKYVGAYVEDKK